MKKEKKNKMSELIDKYNRKPLTVKEKKYIIPVIEVAVGALSISLNQVVIEKRIENLTQYISALVLVTRAIVDE